MPKASTLATSSPATVTALRDVLGVQDVLGTVNIFDDTTAGLAATTDGQYFSVPSADADEYLILYRRDSASVATEIKRYPSGEYITTKATEAAASAQAASDSAAAAAASAAQITEKMVFPETYGALGDGVTDDSSALALAITEAITQNTRVWLAKNYRVTDVASAIPLCAGPGSLNGITVTRDTPFREEMLTRPSWFTWDSGIRPVWDGSAWGINVDPTSFDVASAAVDKVTKYVDRATGSDAASGDSGAPWKTMLKALNWAKANQGTTPNLVIMVTAGTYNRNEFWVSAGLVPTAMNLSIIAVGGRVVLSKQFEAQTWSSDATSGGYVATRSGIAAVWDSKTPDANGDWVKLTYMGTTAASIVAPGQWATDGVSVWVRTSDDRSPDADIRLMLTGVGCYIDNLAGTLYCEGIDFAGGQSAFLVDTNNTVTSKQYFNDCTWGYSTTSNGLTVQGSDGVYCFSGTARRAHRDGLNYHQSTDTTKGCKAFEFDMVCRHNGLSGDSNNNGSTSHDGTIVQRVKVEAYGNEGPGLPDVNGGLVWNVGCVAHDSNSPASGTDFGFYIQGGGRMHLDFCESYGHTADIVVDASNGSILTTRGWGGGLKVTYA